MSSRKRARKQTRVQTVAPRQRWRFDVVGFAAVLLVAGALAYSSSFNGVFVADDEDAIVRNESIRSLATVFDTPRDTTVAGRPVLNLSFALHRVGGGGDPPDPWGFHAVNLAIHLCAGLALFGVTRRSLMSPALYNQFGTAVTPLAFTVALFWVLHPLTTGAVTYVVQRAESLVGLFFLLTLYAALRAEEGGQRSTRWIAGAVVACALGMATKEVMAVAPVVVAVWLWSLRPDTRLADPRRKLLLTGLAATWAILAALIVMSPRSQSVGFGLGGWTPLSYLRTQAEVIVHYLRLSIFPAPLVFMYSWPPASWTEALPELLFLSALAAATLAWLVRRSPAALPGLWFFLILAPSSSLLPIATEVAAEHRMYLPLAGVIAVVVLSARAIPVIRESRTLSLALVIVIAGGLGATTHARNQDYWSIEALMRDTVEKSPTNLRARVIYGGHLIGLERYAEAETHLRAAVSLPERVEAEQGLTAAAHMYLGSSLAAQGKVQDGIPHLERALELAPSLAETHAFLGEAYASQGRLADAASSFERAVELMPSVGAVLQRAASVLDALAAEHARAGRVEEADAARQRAAELSARAAAAATRDTGGARR